MYAFMSYRICISVAVKLSNKKQRQKCEEIVNDDSNAFDIIKLINLNLSTWRECKLAFLSYANAP